MHYEDALRDSLKCLYNESSGFNISIDTIVKLAKLLKLDTFVDAEETPGVKRLSIAGSLLLLEIDFKNDTEVVKVSLSSGNHSSDQVSDAEFSSQVGKNISSDTGKGNGEHLGSANSVVLTFEPHLRASFLRTSNSGELRGEEVASNVPRPVSSAEEILLESLAGPTLGTFPKNLKYLADLDRVSPSESDLIVYIDNMATYLAAIHQIECQLNRDDWQVQEGFTSSFGKITLNDKREKCVGVFLQFWQDFRFFNRESQKNGLGGDEITYKALLTIEESGSAAIDYLAEAFNQPWILWGYADDKMPYIFRGISDTAHLHNQQSAIVGAKWKLVLRFMEPVYLPAILLEYFGITDYERAKSRDFDKYWRAACETGEVSFKNNDTTVSFLFEESPTFILLQAVTIADLHILSALMAALRNQLVFTNLLRNVANAEGSELLISSESCILDEAKRKIRDSLQLSSDFPDEEMLALNPMSIEYGQSGNRDLSDFIEEGDMMETDDLENTPSESIKPYMAITLQEIKYGSPHSDFLLQIEGNAVGFGADIVQIRIQNGRLLANKTEEDVNMDAQVRGAGEEFARSLGLGEDILIALHG